MNNGLYKFSQINDSCNNSEILRPLIWILAIFGFSIIAKPANADCISSQSEVPACLSGTAIAPGYSGAVIQENGEPGLRQVMQGDIVAGWTVEEIGAGYVELKRGTRTARLELPQSPTANAEAVQPATDDALRAVKRGPMKHTRSLARGGE
jgi:hypothetical protein